jgi:hypothetical protein
MFMDYRFKCDCGREITVSQTAAGTLVDCACGRSVRVAFVGAATRPCWRGHSVAGFRGRATFACGASAGRRRLHRLRPHTGREIALLDRLRTRTGRRPHPPTVVVGAAFHPVSSLLWRPSQRRKYGQDVVFPVPFPLCSACRPMVSSTEALKAVLRLTPVYARLLDKYPEAEVSLLHEQ